MKERFEGPDGSRKLLAALLEQRVVERRPEIAEALIADGELMEFGENDTVIEQGGFDTWAYFILTGAMLVYINNRLVTLRGPGELVGEMVTLDLSAPRSATLKAGKQTVVLRVDGTDLQVIADRFPSLWRSMGRVMAERFRERVRFNRPHNVEPIVFVGCSTQAVSMAEQIELQLEDDRVRLEPWTGNVFAGGVEFDNLLKQLQEADFALFIATPDDYVDGRWPDYLAPRDNLIFEMGLSTDRLGSERVFLLHERSLDLKIPTDLLGVTRLTYAADGTSSLAEQLWPACNELRKMIRGLGVV